jgi:vacuolar-type H+-ATPase subunit I/STV1
MFQKSDIRKVTVAFDKRITREVYLALGRAGLVHLARFSEKEALADAGFQAEEPIVSKIIADTSWALEVLGIDRQPSVSDVHLMNAAEDEKAVAAIRRKIEHAQRLIHRIQEEEETLARNLLYAQAAESLGLDMETLRKTKLLKVVFGTVENTDWIVPPYERFLIARAGHFVFGLAPSVFAADLLQFLKEKGFQDQSEKFPGRSAWSLQKRADVLTRRRSALDAWIRRWREEKGPLLRRWNAEYRGYDALLKAMRMSVSSSRVMFITGWVDSSEKAKLLEILSQTCAGQFMIQEQKDPAAPVRLKNARFLKPFELLVKIMGMPSVDELDPTPLAAVTYVMMFGLMFGDLGQGLVLMLIGLVLRSVGTKKAHDVLAQGGGILTACGAWAAICGLLYGSVFSSERILPALWFHPTTDIMKLFFATVAMGAVFIALGLCLNIINRLINSDYYDALLGKRGLAILALYIATISFAAGYVTDGRIPALWSVGVFVFLPLALFTFRLVPGVFFFSQEKPHNLFEYAVETVMEIVEIALSFLANTLSFIRVGAFALSHAGLSVVTYTLAGMASPSLDSAGALAIIVLGNLFIIGFEGMICSIQSLRLEYYEFFSKFFKGDGVAFAPFTLTPKTTEV